MKGIKSLRKWICVIIVIVIILILLEMNKLQSVSNINTSKDTIIWDMGNAKREMKQISVQVASNRRLTMSKDSTHNVSRQFKVSNKRRHHHDSLFNITTQPSRNSTKFHGQSKYVKGVAKTTGDTSKNSKNISGKRINEKGSLSTEGVINKAVKWFTLHSDSLKDDRLNKHKFSYHLTSALCSKKNISIVILVHSAANHTENRQLIRNNWGSVNTDGSHPTIIFMLGETFPREDTLQLNIEKESMKHGDIVQGDFADTYKNLSYKHVMAIHWLTSHCDDVRTIVKIDDDVFVNVFKLVNFSINVGHFPNKLYCHIENKAPPGRTGRWTLSTAEYPFPLFPRYCDGMAYIMSMDVARKLLKASENMAFIWIDDVYVTGFLARKAGVGHKNFGIGHESFLKKRHRRGKVKDILKGYMFYVHLRDWDMLAMLLFGLKK